MAAMASAAPSGRRYTFLLDRFPGPVDRQPMPVRSISRTSPAQLPDRL